jgi:hypothetical protein
MKKPSDKVLTGRVHTSLTENMESDFSLLPAVGIVLLVEEGGANSGRKVYGLLAGLGPRRIVIMAISRNLGRVGDGSWL